MSSLQSAQKISARGAFVRSILAIILITYGLYLGVDWTFAWLYPPEPYDGHRERLYAHAYRQEPYFSAVFLRESFTQPGGWVTPHGTTLVFPREFHGAFFNTDYDSHTKAVYRRTLNPIPQDGQDVVQVLLLGGSTIYNSEVPDDRTVASQLASILNASDRRRFHVINGGVTSIDSAQELARLKYELEHGLRPSVVVVYDGVNDIYNGVYQNNPNGVLFQAEQGRSDGQKLVQVGPKQNPTSEQSGSLHWWQKAFTYLREVFVPSHIYQMRRTQLIRDAQRIVPPHMMDPTQVESAVAMTRARFLAIRREMHELGQAYRFRVISILQSHAFTGGKSGNQDDVRDALLWAERRLPKLREAFDAGYPALQSAARQMRESGFESLDWSALFHEKHEPIFLDFCHVTSAGNRMIAEAMARAIL